MKSGIEERFEDLESWDRGELLAEWQKIFGPDIPKHLSQPLMIRVIFYKWQEGALGSLPTVNQKLLDRMAANFGRDPSNLRPEFQIKTGTRLRRLYQGKIHEVTSAQDGFVYDGNKYGSLSEIARLITGTRWNGRIFFGLKSARDTRSRQGGTHDQA